MRIAVSGSMATIIAPLKKLQPMAVRAMQEGLQEGGEKVRTQVRRALKEQTNVKRYGVIVAHVPGHCNGFIYTIDGVGKGLRIEEFPGRVSKSLKTWVRWSPRQHWRLQERHQGRFGELPQVSDKGDVYSIPWGVGRTFVRSFAREDGALRQAVPSGGKRKWSFKTLDGPSISKEIIKDKSQAAFYEYVQVAVMPAIEKRLARVMD